MLDNRGGGMSRCWRNQRQILTRGVVRDLFSKECHISYLIRCDALGPGPVTGVHIPGTVENLPYYWVVRLLSY